ncbi:MAG: dephospho-CoA kinase [Candidatus Obscuribacterales bacterium]|nr:dephospho-CoA kinase [Candidatus Obscuribacterales bacterium]
MSVSEKRLPFVLGITGTIGSGKSLIGKCLVECGIPILDSDAVVHSLFRDDQEVIEQISSTFGPTVVKKDEHGLTMVDRQTLGAIVFANPDARTKLEQIVHPAVHRYCTKWIESQDEDVVALLIPLLFETARPRKYDQVWSVTCDEKILRERLKARNNFSEEEIDARLNAQLPQSEKASRADHVIDNSGDIESTRKKLIELVQDLKKKIVAKRV